MSETPLQTAAGVSRREFLKRAGLASAALAAAGSLSSLLGVEPGGPFGWLGPAQAEAAPGRDVREVLRSTFGDRTIQPSHVVLKTPIIAEDGRVVPVEVESDLPMEPGDYVKRIYLFVDENAQPFVASVDLTPACGKAAYALRIKMRKTSQVRAVVETSKGVLYGDKKTVKVTIGGCGG